MSKSIVQPIINFAPFRSGTKHTFGPCVAIIVNFTKSRQAIVFFFVKTTIYNFNKFIQESNLKD